MNARYRMNAGSPEASMHFHGYFPLSGKWNHIMISASCLIRKIFRTCIFAGFFIPRPSGPFPVTMHRSLIAAAISGHRVLPVSPKFFHGVEHEIHPIAGSFVNPAFPI
jgi:hypothetical protein